MNRRTFSVLTYAYRLSPNRRVSVHMQIMAQADIQKKAIKPRNSRRQVNKLPLTKSKTTRPGYSSNVINIHVQNELKIVNTNDLWQGLYLARPIMSMAIQRHVLQNRSSGFPKHSTPLSLVSKILQNSPHIINIYTHCVSFDNAFYRTLNCKFSLSDWEMILKVRECMVVNITHGYFTARDSRHLIYQYSTRYVFQIDLYVSKLCHTNRE